jgi:hypothetical protein
MPDDANDKKDLILPPINPKPRRLADECKELD